MAFDLEGARKAGGSDSDIASYLASKHGYDLDGARAAGGTDAQIISHLMQKEIPTTPPKSKGRNVGGNLESLVYGATSLPRGLLQYVDEKFPAINAHMPEGLDLKGLKQLEQDQAEREVNAKGDWLDQKTKGKVNLAELSKFGGNVVDPNNFIIPGAALSKGTAKVIASGAVSGAALGGAKYREEGQTRLGNMEEGALYGSVSAGLLKGGHSIYQKFFPKDKKVVPSRQDLEKIVSDIRATTESKKLESAAQTAEREKETQLQAALDLYKYNPEVKSNLDEAVTAHIDTHGHKQNWTSEQASNLISPAWDDVTKRAANQFANSQLKGKGLPKEKHEKVHKILSEDFIRQANTPREVLPDQLELPLSTSLDRQAELQAELGHQGDLFTEQATKEGNNLYSSVPKKDMPNTGEREALRLEQANYDASVRLAEAQARNRGGRVPERMDTSHGRDSVGNEIRLANDALEQADFEASQRVIAASNRTRGLSGEPPESPFANSGQTFENTALAQKQASAFMDRVFNKGRGVNADKELEKLSKSNPATYSVVTSRLMPQVETLLSKQKATGKIGESVPPLSQGGFIHPQMLAPIAGAGAGAISDPEHPVEGALMGAAVGLGGVKAAQKFGKSTLETSEKSFLEKAGEQLSDAAHTPDHLVRPLMGTLNGIDESLGLRAAESELHLMKDTASDIKGVDPFLLHTEHVLGEHRDLLKDLWFKGDREGLKAISKATGGKEIEQSFQSFLDSYKKIGEELRSVGLMKEGQGLEEGLPRKVKDYDGLRQAMGRDSATMLDKALAKEAFRLKKPVSTLSEEERDKVISQVLSNRGGTGKSGYLKGRVLETVPQEFQKYYYEIPETVTMYLRKARSDIAKARFFGKEKIVDGDGNLNFGDSLINYVNKVQLEKGLSDKQITQLRDVIQNRWVGAEKAPAEWAKNVRNLTTATTIADVSSAASNIGDAFVAMGTYGPRAGLASLFQVASGRAALKKEDFGLLDHVSEEFLNTGKTATLARRTMKASGWGILDPLGKEVNLNSSLNRGFNRAKSEGGKEWLRAKYGDAFREDTEQLVSDLASGKRTHLTDLMAWNDVQKHIPLSRWQKTEFQTRNPTAAPLLTQFMSYMTMNLNGIRENVLHEMKKGFDSSDPYQSMHLKHGVATAISLGAALLASGATQTQVNNFLRGRDDDPFGEDVYWNMTKQFGFTKDLAQNIQQGHTLKGVAGMVLPSSNLATRWFKEDPYTGKYGVDDKSTISALPVIGKEVAGYLYPQKSQYENQLETTAKRTRHRMEKEYGR